MPKKKDQRLPPPEEVRTKNERWNRDLSPALLVLSYDYIEILKQVKSMHEIGYDVHCNGWECNNFILVSTVTPSISIYTTLDDDE